MKIVKSFFLDLQDVMALYLLKPKCQLDYYIDLCGDFFDKIKSNNIYFHYIQPIY